MKQKKVTYYIGAGASANCLPLVNEMSGRLKELKETIRGYLQPLDNIVISPKKFHSSALINRGTEIVEDIEWLLDEMENHFTIDTLAKRFYLTSNGHSDLLKLKRVLYLFFLYEQGIKEGQIRKNIDKELPDKRYDSFIATLISNEIDKLELPKNVNIITWNYDIQFELAYQVYDSSGIYKSQEKLNVFPDFNKQRVFTEDAFSLVHLNGMIYPIPEWKRCENIKGLSFPEFDEKYQKYIERICYNYGSITEDFLRRLNFSWEDPQKYTLTEASRLSCIEIAKKIMNKTDILVVIGYSFPLFNRQIDSDIMSRLNSNVESIYIQDISSRVENLVDLFINSFSSKISLNKGSLVNIVKPVPYVDQFYFPSDLI